MSPRPTNDNHAADDAAAWLLRRDAGLELEKDQEFLTWRSASQENAQAWDHALSVWKLAGDAGSDHPLMAALRRDALQARPPRLPFAAIGAAAAAAAAALVVILAWPQLSPPTTNRGTQPGPAADAPATFANQAGPPNTFALADGSRVTLNANSAVAVAYDGKHRAVRLLRGQAFFSVTHDASRPFTVAAGARTITDLGTEFDVRLAGQALTVTLKTGAVAVSPVGGGKPVNLSSPGQQLTSAPGKADAVAQVDLDEALGWRTSMLEFSERPLADAIAEMNRYGGPPARIIAPAVSKLPVTGQFRAGDPTRFAHALAAVSPVSVHERADGGADIGPR